MNGWMDGWMDGWMYRWMDGWMDGWIYVHVCVYCIYNMYVVYMDGWMDVPYNRVIYATQKFVHFWLKKAISNVCRFYLCAALHGVWLSYIIIRIIFVRFQFLTRIINRLHGIRICLYVLYV